MNGVDGFREPPAGEERFLAGRGLASLRSAASGLSRK